MSRPALRGRVAAWVNAGGLAGSVVKSLILGAPALRSARARNTTPTPTATAPPRPRPRARAAWTTLTAPTTSPPIPPSAKSPKPTIPGTSRSPASAGPTTKSAPAITPKTLRKPPRGLASSIASSSVDVLLAVAQLDVAVGVHDRHVAGVEPAAAKGFGGGGRIVEVAGHDVVAAHDHLAQGLAVGGHVAHLGVDDAELAGDQVGHPLPGPQACARLGVVCAPLRVPVAHGVRSVRFGEAVDVADLGPDPLLLREERGRRRRA